MTVANRRPAFTLMRMVVGLHHVQLSIAPGRVEASLRFYVDLIGFTPIEDPFKIEGFWLAAGAHQLHCRVEPDIDRRATRAHPAFLLDDLSAVQQKLLDAGFELDHQADFAGYRRFHVLDPSGNRIELMQHLADN
ncbi:MAG: VOC family protein [Tepidisphaeraceae bacterium]